MDLESPPGEQLNKSLAFRISSALRRDLSNGVFQAGDRLPSESALTRQYAVSRTVVREAIAVLRADGLVEARKGAGVFALAATPVVEQPFHDLTTERISSVIELLELRTVFEVEAAALAASRRSATQIETIVDAHRIVSDCLATNAPTRDADFNFHMAIAQATQNRRFPEFLQLIRTGIIPRGDLQGSPPGGRPKDYNLHLQQEHAVIVDAIIEGDADSARLHMRAHLRGSLERYRALLRAQTSAKPTDRQ